MIDRAMMRRLLTQCGMETVVMDDATMRLAEAIFAAGMSEEREECAKTCEAIQAKTDKWGPMAGYCAEQIRMRSNELNSGG